MKRFPFLLLDAGPIIKLFELGIWDEFIKRCDVTISRTVVEDEVVFARKEDNKEYIDFGLKPWEKEELIKIIEVALPTIQSFLRDSTIGIKYAIDPGEAETLAFLANSSEDFILCTADGPVFSALGFLDKAEKGISLEELLQKVGLTPSQKLEWWFSKKFREKYTQMGKIDSIQNKNFT